MSVFHLTKTALSKMLLNRVSITMLSVILWSSTLTACESFGDPAAGSKAVSAAKTTPQDPNAGHDSLSPRNLSPGECGLFVWAGEARRFILFAQNGQSAVLAKDGAELPLTPKAVDVSGDFYNQIAVQDFSDAQGTDYSLSLAAEEVIDGGIRYASGTWRYKDPSGWDVIKPVYGLSTCQALK